MASKILRSVERDASLYKEDENEKNHESTHEHHHHDDCHCDHHHEHEEEHHHEDDCHCDHHHEHKEEHHHHHKEKNNKLNYILLIIGFVLYITMICLEKFANVNEIILRVGYIISYLLISYDIILDSFNGFIHKDFFNENLLMIVASVGALAINESIEGIMVILLFKIGEYFQDRATNKSKNAIKSLLELKKDTVTLTDGKVKNVKDVNIGEVITVHVGEQIPLDGIIKSGNTNVDMKTLTGESVPVFASIGEEILSGSINLTRVIDVEVTKKENESTIAKVLKLVEEATDKKSKSEKFITKFARIYTPLVLIIAIIVGLIQGLFLKISINDVMNNVFSILVISCPCALVISIPLGYFSGIGRSSAAGILVKGGNYLEALATLDTFVFDKTGTITKGNFKVKEIYPVSPCTKEELLELVAMVEQYSIHPIANAIKEAYQKDVKKINDARVEEIAGSGLKVNIDNKEILVGNSKLMDSNKIDYIINNEVGTILYISENNKFLGSIVICDEIKEEAYSLLKYLNSKDYRSVMLTGDSEQVAKNVCEEVGINEYYAKILPQDKYERLQNIISDTKKGVCYVGDGINDTPSLKLANVGIAMGGIGSDSAKECADIVIMNDDLEKIQEGISIAKYTRKIIYENIVFALSIKILAMIIGILGILHSYAMILALFADVGVCILAILNVLRILKYKYKVKK